MKKWTEKEIAYLKRWYRYKSYEEIGKHLGRSMSSVRHYAERHGLQKRIWTKEEDEYLMKWFGVRSNEDIAKSLKRTVAAIGCRVWALDLGAKNQYGEEIDMTEISRLVGKKKNVLYSTWVKRGIKYTNNFGYNMVKPEDLFEFMKNNPDLYDATKCEKYFFESQPWFREKLLADRKKHCDERWGIISA